MLIVNSDYNIAEDIEFLMESDNINKIEFANRAKISRTTLLEILKEPLNKSNVHTGTDLFPSYHTNFPCLTPVRRRPIYTI